MTYFFFPNTCTCTWGIFKVKIFTCLSCRLYTKISFPKGCFAQNFIEIGQVVLEKGFECRIFRSFAIISPWKRGWLFIWISLIPFYWRTLCADFDWNWIEINCTGLHICWKLATSLAKHHPIENLCLLSR